MYDDTILERFWSKVNKTNGCWEWTGRINARGYGAYGKRVAHRVIWEQIHGPIPSGMCICHHCDNPACVRLDHLFIGTHSDNIKDAVIKGRVVPPDSRGEKHGRSRLSDNDVYEIRRLYSLGVAHKTIAKMWRISRPNVRAIVYRRNWRHI